MGNKGCGSECNTLGWTDQYDADGRKLMVAMEGNTKYLPMEIHPQCKSCALEERVDALMGLKKQGKTGGVKQAIEWLEARLNRVIDRSRE